MVVGVEAREVEVGREAADLGSVRKSMQRCYLRERLTGRQSWSCSPSNADRFVFRFRKGGRTWAELTPTIAGLLRTEDGPIPHRIRLCHRLLVVELRLCKRWRNAFILILTHTASLPNVTVYLWTKRWLRSNLVNVKNKVQRPNSPSFQSTNKGIPSLQPAGRNRVCRGFQCQRLAPEIRWSVRKEGEELIQVNTMNVRGKKREIYRLKESKRQSYSTSSSSSSSSLSPSNNDPVMGTWLVYWLSSGMRFSLM